MGIVETRFDTQAGSSCTFCLYKPGAYSSSGSSHKESDTNMKEAKKVPVGYTLIQKIWQLRLRVAGMAFAALLFVLLAPTLAYAGSGPDWPTYQNEIGRSGDNSAETTISPTTAPNLKLHWMHSAAGSISTQPVVANNLVYWGSWDNGTEHTTNFSNARIWTYNTGVTTDNSCIPTTAGIASTTTVATVPINGTSTSVAFFGGGTATMYALNALTGKLIWSTNLGSSPSHFIWSSPAVYNGSVYIGVSSFGDCPLVAGQVVQLNASTGAIQHIFNTVPSGCVGAGVWGSPTIDPAGNGGQGAVYITTGNNGNCSSSEPYAYAIVELSAANISTVIGSWSVPSSQQVSDSDFGATPTLFTANGQNMVGGVNKNGIFYAFKRDALGSGPVWQTRVGNGGDCPQCGTGNISPAAWDGTTLYEGSGNITINGKACKGSVDAINPANGSFIWRHCLNDGPVLGPIAVANGVVAAGQGRYLMVLAASNGNTLYRFEDTNSGSLFYGGPSISHGVIYIGNMDGRLYAIGT
jgi:polyvinyl alcohol dehydrogenase (cytochrome)